MIRSSFFILLILLFSCNKESEFIEVTQGIGMNPAEPRYGVLVTSNNELFFCNEIISNGKRTSKYKYYKYNESIDFSSYKEMVLKNFKDKINSKSLKVNDAEYYQLKYKTSSKQYKSIFFESDLNPEQFEILMNFIRLPDNKLKLSEEIPFYNFSSDLLMATTVPLYEVCNFKQ
ncbi:hypothetical protein GCM10010992_26020 [Cloacibacterium rupense]|uniref:Lipoprotein n=2 Tax=Cloacibacterium rupense TaxID=517423 RepID=A0ABQ2NMN9_9FLAO|nr:hypothetical protein GCM10010992_26020 [Cloacibacterium rupense]